MCCQAQAIDQQPLKTAQFYVIPRKCEELSPHISRGNEICGLAAIEHAPQARAIRRCLSGQSLSVFITRIHIMQRRSRFSIHIVVFTDHLKYYPSPCADAELPTVVEFPYIPKKNTEPALEAPLQVITIY